jgi:putative solute:sodium symporter small subunit
MSPPTPPEFESKTDDRRMSQRQRYWRGNLKIVCSLLLLWFVAGYGISILLIEWFNGFRLGQLEFGFWFAQQGSILTFVILVAAYAWLMDRLDRNFLLPDRQDSEGGGIHD